MLAPTMYIFLDFCDHQLVHLTIIECIYGSFRGILWSFDVSVICRFRNYFAGYCYFLLVMDCDLDNSQVHKVLAYSFIGFCFNCVLYCTE